VSLGIGIGIATFIAAATGTALTWRASRREGTADVRLDEHYIRENPPGPARVVTIFSNRGPAHAYEATTWLQPSGGAPHRPDNADLWRTIPPGEAGSLLHDLPARLDGEEFTIWIAWRDKRGVRMRDSGARLRPKASE
jgi:hypothetical protein